MYAIGTILKVNNHGCNKNLNIGDLAVVVDSCNYLQVHAELKAYVHYLGPEVINEFICVEWLNTTNANGFYAIHTFVVANAIDLAKPTLLVSPIIGRQ